LIRARSAEGSSREPTPLCRNWQSLCVYCIL